MVAPAHLLAMSLVALVIIAVPGPSVLFVISRGVSLGRRAALSTVIGNEIGLSLQVAAVAFGLGAILAESVAAFTVLKLAGAGYLIYLGIRTLRRRDDLVAALRSTATPVRTRRILLDGVVVGVTNPKSLLLFGAILPQFADPVAGQLPLHPASALRNLPPHMETYRAVDTPADPRLVSMSGRSAGDGDGLHGAGSGAFLSL